MTMMQTGIVPPIELPLGLELARRHAGLTQKELADQLGLSRGSVQGYEQGLRMPKRPTLMAWASLTGVSYEWLAGLQYTPSDSNREPADLRFKSSWTLAS